MLRAYIGETGAFIDRRHSKFNTSPAFGYAGFIIPAENARRFGAVFEQQKRILFRTELVDEEHPGRWERKGSRIFRSKTLERFPQQIRVFDSLVGTVRGDESQAGRTVSRARPAYDVAGVRRRSPRSLRRSR